MRALCLLAILMLAGCVPIPIPATGDREDSRQNIADGVPDFIVAGQTTRADVLLALGDPDQRAEDDRCFLYLRTSDEGGIAFVYGGGGRGGITGQPVTFRMLTVTFDERGVVDAVRAETRVQRDFGPHLTKPPQCEPR